MSKRELAAAVLRRSGALTLLEQFRSKPGILIVNHHRVGDAASTRFDRDVFSASADAFDMQLKYFKRHFPIVAGEELEDLVSGKTPLKRTYIAVTFDDGYINDYARLFPHPQGKRLCRNILSGPAVRRHLLYPLVGRDCLPRS